MEAGQIFLLIDENLSPRLVRAAALRGFRAVHVNDVSLTTRDDKQITRYALRREMILVTRNMLEFEERYRTTKMHPGLVFIVADAALKLTRARQATLFDLALTEIFRSEPVQEAILVRMTGETPAGLVYELKRYELPSHD